MPDVGFEALAANEGAVSAANVHYLQALLAPPQLGVIAGSTWIAEDYVIVSFTTHPNGRIL
jgi:hypothetical protein